MASVIKSGLKAAVTTPFKWARNTATAFLERVGGMSNWILGTKFKDASGVLLDSNDLGDLMGIFGVAGGVFGLLAGGHALLTAGVLSAGAVIGLGILASPFAVAAGIIGLTVAATGIAFAAGIVATPINFVRGCTSAHTLNSAQNSAQNPAPAAQAPITRVPITQAPAVVTIVTTLQESIDVAIGKIHQLPVNERQAAATQLKKRLTNEFGAAVEPEDLTATISPQATKPTIKFKKGLS